MLLLLFFAVTSFAAVLLSCLAKRTVLSTAVFFLAAGFLYDSGWIFRAPEPNVDLLQRLSEFALFAVLFTDGMRTGGLHEIRQNWRLPSRALLIGMPLTIVGIALLGHWLVSLSWGWAFLIGAVLSPTDPVFVAAVFEVQAVPQRLKRLLNMESGVNDGLALPLVILLLATQKIDVAAIEAARRG
ncbi:MAG TPA: cation:proton antiporter [Candidatus Limnocylindrales bacterium]|nr:cation:proton antiporter [Candidatus Limnocylindrales bacterium]